MNESSLSKLLNITVYFRSLIRLEDEDMDVQIHPLQERSFLFYVARFFVWNPTFEWRHVHSQQRRSTAEPQPKLRVVLEGFVKKVSFTAEAQRTERKRRG